MPLTSPGRRVSDAEAKLTLLYAVDALESATESEIWAFAAENELMDYITTRLCLGELLAGGELQYGEKALRDRLLLTDAGRRSLVLFLTRIPNSVRGRIDAAAPAFGRRAETRRQIEAVYELASRGHFILRLSLRESELPLLLIRLHTADRELAARALRRFPSRAPTLGSSLYDDAARPPECFVPFPLAPPLPLVEAFPLADNALYGDAFTVTRHSAHEYTALCNLRARQAAFSLALLLPDEPSAHAFLRQAQTPGYADRALRLLV